MLKTGGNFDAIGDSKFEEEKAGDNDQFGPSDNLRKFDQLQQNMRDLQSKKT